MSKKYSLIINIAMIVIGIIGMLFYYMSSKKPQYKPSQVQKVVQTKVIEAPTESITVAVAKKNLQKGTRLTSGDFQLETLKIKEGGNEKSTLSVGDIDNWMLKSDISEGAKIPQAILVKPGSEEYIKMSAKPGSIVYGFSIKKNDSYLFNNAQAGGGVDIYLAYNLRVTKDESGEIKTAPVTDATDHINGRHFKMLMKNKKILSIQTVTSKVKAVVNEQNPMINEGYVLVELTPAEVIMLKGLEDAKLYIFPTSENIAEFDPAHSVLVGDEGQWPIDNRNILSTAVQSATTIQNDSEFIRVFRGENSANSSINSK
ncbi:TPA: hypothetical protein MC588_003691 [Citrobacter amalonaticus]|uniref:hypothetical protein n=1 Tax=Citrobacter amalonaticus TaxID=35703 RepID=UPI003D97B4F7|nr:hypothetical protein [Citrobacter amalonaticus]